MRDHPDAVAAVHGHRALTYRALNARANRLGRALLAHGLRREGVVAVVTERNLDWMAAVLAIFKAGGAYLPIEPQLPAARMATMLSRASMVESSSGNLGVALSMVAASKGHRFVCVTDKRCNLATRRLMEAMGSHVHVAPPRAGCSGPGSTTSGNCAPPTTATCGSTSTPTPPTGGRTTARPPQRSYASSRTWTSCSSAPAQPGP